MQRKVADAMQPLRNRLQENTPPSNNLEAQKLSREEEAEVNAIAPPVGRALTLEERQKIGAIRESYAEKRKALAGKESESSRDSLIVLKEVMEMTSDCWKAGAAKH